MYASVEECKDGYLIEVRADRADPTILVMPGLTDWKKVCTNYGEVEKYLQELFIKRHRAIIQDHEKSG